MKTHKKLCLTLGAVLFAVILLIALKPTMSKIRAGISGDISERDKYAASEYNFGIIGVARGKDLKTAQSETFIGVAGMVFSADTGAAKAAGDILLWLPQLGRGTQITISLTVTAMLAGLVLGIFLALGKIAKFKPLSKFCSVYIFFFRGTPLLMQLYFLYYGLPTISPALTINDKFLAAFIAFSLNFGAYCAEIVRAAIQSIDKGQFEASKALGMTSGQTMRLVVLPQTVRRLIPPVANEFIMALKDASLVSIIALSDLTHVSQSISSSTASVTVFIPAMIIYLIITAVFTFIFNKIEKKFSLYE